MSASTSAASEPELETIEQFAVRIAHELAHVPVHRRRAEFAIRDEIARGRIVVDEGGRVLGRDVDAELAAALDALELLTS